MAHFAELNAENKVLRVIVVGNPDCLDDNGNESEQVGIAFCRSLFGPNTKWLQTSYNGNFRGTFAVPGATYDEAHDCFIPPSLVPSFVFNFDTLQWEPPIPYPTDGQTYDWDEASTQWVVIPEPTPTDEVTQ